MSNAIVRRAYTYKGAPHPTMFYYHQRCWSLVAPEHLANLGEEALEPVPAVNGSVQLIALEEVEPGAHCFQCPNPFIK